MRRLLDGLVKLERFKPSPAMVVACAALAVALGGSAYAVTKLPPKSVGTAQLKANAVTSPKIRNATVTGADVNERTLAKVPLAAKASNAGNAAMLGGLDPNAFLRSNGKAVDAAHADNADNAASATDASTLDGNAPSAFLGASAKAADSDLLDGVDSADFVRSSHFLTSSRVTHNDANRDVLINSGAVVIQDDGDTDADHTVNVKNNASAGFPSITVLGPSGQTIVSAPGNVDVTTAGDFLDIFIQHTTSVAHFTRCAFHQSANAASQFVTCVDLRN